MDPDGVADLGEGLAVTGAELGDGDLVSAEGEGNKEGKENKENLHSGNRKSWWKT